MAPRFIFADCPVELGCCEVTEDAACPACVLGVPLAEDASGDDVRNDPTAAAIHGLADPCSGCAEAPLFQVVWGRSGRGELQLIHPEPLATLEFHPATALAATAPAALPAGGAFTRILPLPSASFRVLRI